MRPGFGFFAAVSLAIVITALTLPGRQTIGVVNSLATGAVRLTEASLGQMPH
jgi:hypothetical protein